MLDRKYFKTDEAHKGQEKCHKLLVDIMQYVVDYCEKNFNKSPVFTETRTTSQVDKMLGRVSKSHQQGRAFDLRVWTFTEMELRHIYEALNHNYSHFGAWTKLGHRQLVVHHDSGHGDHFHVQLDTSYAVA